MNTRFFITAAGLLFSVFGFTQSSEKIHSTHPPTLPVEWKGEEPKIQFTVEPCDQAGWLVSTSVSDFKFTPEKSGKKHTAGEGHMHLFVDGKKLPAYMGSHIF